MKRLMLGMALVLMVGAVVMADGPKAQRTDARVYVVADLVLTTQEQAAVAAKKANLEPLIELLTSSVAKDTWTKDDGKDGRVNTITPFYLNNSLIIRATPDVQDQIVERLRQVRKLAAVRAN